MQKTLVDSGPLIALFNRDDHYHSPVMEFLKDFRGLLYTTWPVITEVTHLLDFNSQVQIDFLTWVSRGALKLIDLDPNHLLQIIQMMNKYEDIPMDLADGSLMAIAESLNIQSIITVDSDYYIYRTFRKKALKNLIESHLKK